jgi:hypothetical protein
MVLAANGRLWLLSPAGALRAFAPTYHSNPGLEAYITLAGAGHDGCSFGADTVYAISFGSPRGVVAISAQGRVRPFATISASGLIDGIAFDETGRFGYRLLVATTAGKHTSVDAVDCHGAVTSVTRSAHRVEGGFAVAPATFGRFAGDLIESDELGGGVYAVTSGGRNLLVASSGLPRGGDTGVESEAFLPAGRFAALLADRLTPGNPHPGDNVLLRLGSGELFAAGARPGAQSEIPMFLCNPAPRVRLGHKGRAWGAAPAAARRRAPGWALGFATCRRSASTQRRAIEFGPFLNTGTFAYGRDSLRQRRRNMLHTPARYACMFRSAPAQRLCRSGSTLEQAPA